MVKASVSVVTSRTKTAIPSELRSIEDDFSGGILANILMIRRTKILATEQMRHCAGSNCVSEEEACLKGGASITKSHLPASRALRDDV